MEKHPTKRRRYLCDNPENIIISFSPPDSSRQITFGFRQNSVDALPVENDQIQFQIGANAKILYVKFVFPGGSDTRCKVQIQGSSGGDFEDTPTVNPATSDGMIRIYTFE